MIRHTLAYTYLTCHKRFWTPFSDYAYPPKDDFEIIRWRSWESREQYNRREHGKTYEQRPFPGPFVADFLISKIFFQNACNAFFGNGVVTRPNRYYAGESSSRYNVISCFLKTAVLDLQYVAGLLWHCKYVARRPGQPIRRLVINVNDRNMNMEKTKYPWEGEYTFNDFRYIAKEYQLEYLALAKEYTFNFEPSYLISGNEKVHMWQLNIRNFEEHVREYVMEVGSRFRKDEKVEATEDEDASESTDSEERDDGLAAEGEDASKTADPEQDTELTVDQLPSSAEEMIMLLQTDGKRVMELIESLKPKRCSNGAYDEGS